MTDWLIHTIPILVAIWLLLGAVALAGGMYLMWKEYKGQKKMKGKAND